MGDEFFVPDCIAAIDHPLRRTPVRLVILIIKVQVSLFLQIFLNHKTQIPRTSG
jgi:hypothetical protein